MVSKFWEYYNSDEEDWNIITEKEDLTVWKHKHKIFCYRIDGVLEATPAAIISKLYNNVENRPKWDTQLEKQYIVESCSVIDRIIYVQTKPVWPCSARDFVLYTYTQKLDNGEILNIATSYEHLNEPERENIVRAHADIVGQIFRRHESDPNKSYITQIADVDIKGIIPSQIIQLVTSYMLPGMIKNLNEQVKDLPYMKEWHPPCEPVASIKYF
jgi:hypothetical protein